MTLLNILSQFHVTKFCAWFLHGFLHVFSLHVIGRLDSLGFCIFLVLTSSHQQAGEDVADNLKSDEAGAESDNQSRVGLNFVF